MKLSVVIPAHNEEKRILPTLGSVDSYLQGQNYDYEIIVVNDGSKDDTRGIVLKLKNQNPKIKIIDLKVNQGKARAVRTGMLAAMGDSRLFMDADNSTRIENLDKMMSQIKKGYDIVIASIGIKGARVIGGEPFYKRLLGKLGNLWIQFWILPGIKDTQRGFKLFTARAAEEIFPKMRTFGWGFDAEILALARKSGHRIREVPVEWNNPRGSKVNLWAYPQVLWQVLKVRWNLWTNKYSR